MQRSQPVTMWFDHRVVMRPSPIQGVGVFATHPISAGEQLAHVAGGLVYTSEDWRSGRVQLAGDLYNESQIGDDLFVATPKGVWYYVNHSCDPNTLGGIARRDIAAGEELTQDYALYEAGDYLLEPCGCGSTLCRGRVTGSDWQLPDLQQRYHGRFAPHIQRLIGRTVHE